jgi:hypothetical protein
MTSRYISNVEMECFVVESHYNIKPQLPDLQYLILYNSFFTDLNIINKYFFTNIVLIFIFFQNQFFKKALKNATIQNFVLISRIFKNLEKLFSFI